MNLVHEYNLFADNVFKVVDIECVYVQDRNYEHTFVALSKKISPRYFYLSNPLSGLSYKYVPEKDSYCRFLSEVDGASFCCFFETLDKKHIFIVHKKGIASIIQDRTFIEELNWQIFLSAV